VGSVYHKFFFSKKKYILYKIYTIKTIRGIFIGKERTKVAEKPIKQWLF